MNEFQATAVMIGLFALRCIVPVLITLALGYLMNRLVDHWEAEDAQGEMPVAEEKPQVVTAVPPTTKPQRTTLPCWLTRGCDPARRADCPAFQQRGVPCWTARQRIEGAIPSNCPGCPVYQQAHA